MKKHSNKKLIIIITIIVVLLSGAGVLYFLFNNNLLHQNINKTINDSNKPAINNNIDSPNNPSYKKNNEQNKNIKTNTTDNSDNDDNNDTNRTNTTTTTTVNDKTDKTINTIVTKGIIDKKDESIDFEKANSDFVSNPDNHYVNMLASANNTEEIINITKYSFEQMDSKSLTYTDKITKQDNNFTYFTRTYSGNLIDGRAGKLTVDIICETNTKKLVYMLLTDFQASEKLPSGGIKVYDMLASG